MSQSFGTGQPITFKCHRCRGWRSRHRGDPKPTGRFKKLSDYQHLRKGRYKVEYKCAMCGHVGWSTHVDAERMLIASGFVGKESEFKPS